MNIQLRSRSYQYLFILTLFVGCISAIALLQIPKLNYLKKGTQIASIEAISKELKIEELQLNTIKKIPDFGFGNLFANWEFLKFIQYFGDDQARQLTDYRLGYKYFEIILDRDPRFLESYIFLSTSSTIYAGMPEKSVEIMEKALKSLSPRVPVNSYFIWRYKATDELLFLGNGQAAKQSFEKAAEWASYYSDPESQSVAALSRKTAEFLSKNPNSKSAQINAWLMVLSNAFDQRTRIEAINRIESLGAKVIITPEGKIQKILIPKQD